MPDINKTDLVEDLRAAAMFWEAGGVEAERTIEWKAADAIEAQAAEISRLRDALTTALPAIDGYVDRCDFTKGNAIREIARTALEANHG